MAHRKKQARLDSARYKYQATSREAWQSVLPYLPKVDAEIFGAIAQDGGATSEEVETTLRMKHQTVSAEISHMVDAELLKDGGDRRKTTSGRKAIVWELA
jgi:hypothetical protein